MLTATSITYAPMSQHHKVITRKTCTGWGCSMVRMGKNIANCSRNHQFLLVMFVLCMRCVLCTHAPYAPVFQLWFFLDDGAVSKICTVYVLHQGGGGMI